MKTLRTSGDIHRKLTATVGTLIAQTGKMQTYQDAIEAMLTRSVILPSYSTHHAFRNQKNTP